MDRSPAEATVDRRVGEPTVPEPLLEATRALLWVKTSADAKNVAAELVSAFGGVMVPATGPDAGTLPVDLSFGDGEPALPAAVPASTARMLLERYLPSFVADAHRALELNSQVDRLAEDASIDVLTKLSNRRMIDRALGRMIVGDVVIMVDLDHFKEINDLHGHDAGDRVLRAFGHAIRSNLRGRDFAGRYGGEEFVIILRDATDPIVFIDRLGGSWRAQRPYPVTFSSGIAVVGKEASSALPAADHAMYRAKEAGRDRWMWAREGDDEDKQPIAVTHPAPHLDATFIAFSQLYVPEGGEVEVEQAFRERLGAVEGWPGFQSLEVWADLSDPTGYVMVSWWASPEAFKTYMRSDDHRRSHDRIPDGELRPRPRRFRRFRIVSR